MSRLRRGSVFTILVFILAGAVTGLMTTYALDMKKPKELAQGALGGVIVGIVLSLLMPK
jgi:hypothetical protein